MTEQSASLTASIWNALGGDRASLASLTFDGDGALPSAFCVTDLAGASIAAASLAVAELVSLRRGALPKLRVDRRLASFWFGSSIRPVGWSLPAPWDPIAGDYASADGWIRLHTNAPHHRAAAERVLGRHADREAMAAAVSRWTKTALEAAIVDAGGCAAEMRTVGEWQAHPQGVALADEPLTRLAVTDAGPAPGWKVEAARPLDGIRVLDLTRVLAGPIASRFLAGYGANVLRIDPPDWNEPGVIPEVTLGKRCARLDLTLANDRARFQSLLASADVLLHGYRANALERLGFDAATRARLNPALVDVSLNAYGWSGPWRNRRGFDSLVQMSAGIADAGMRWKTVERPTPLPVQALDHATGYLLAAAAVRGVVRRLSDGRGSRAQFALARTARLLVEQGHQPSSSSVARETEADLAAGIERTPWGEARRLSPPACIDGTPMRWDSPAAELGSSEPAWA
jgi:hypothetical protein